MSAAPKRSAKSGQKRTTFGNGFMTMRTARNRAASRRRRPKRTCHGRRGWLMSWPTQPQSGKKS